MKTLSSQLVRTRMAPSPTGELHVGSLATLLKNYAYAKKHRGQFILRIEDTDKIREVEGGVESIMNIIKMYGLNWDEGPDKGGECGPYIQSERLTIYQQYAHELIKRGKAYRCFCTKDRLEKLRQEQQQKHQPPGYDRHCYHLPEAQINEKLNSKNPFVIRLNVPENQEVVFEDVLRGQIKFNSNEIDDQVLLKSDGYPTYHLAVVVDDHLMNITHIIRGEEWISSAPKHVLIYQAFGWSLPVFCHVPLFLNPDGKGKMSKRKGTVSARSFLEKGYLPEALLNFLMILGWTPKDQRELVSLPEYIDEFDIQDLHPNNVVFDLKKLDWLNGVYIRQLSIEQLTKKITPFLPSDFPKDKLPTILSLIRERLVRLSDVESLSSYFFRKIETNPTLVCKNSTPAVVLTQLTTTVELISSISEFKAEILESQVRQIQETNHWHRGQYYMMLRLGLTGATATPPLFATMEVLGEAKVIDRLKQLIDQINHHSQLSKPS